mmetsp:Transcript_11642/g.14474  ORF Transcript_11642/g.14474 Transcript_11642/m.14474 type:complete len:252 (+) Transcript_11642:943-1698(+)
MARASLFASSLFLRARPTFSVPRQTLFTSPIVNGGGIGLRKHIDTDRNNESTPFEFTAENYKKVKEIRAKYPSNYQDGATIPLLHLAQEQVGWLPLTAMQKVAKILSIPNIRVYETATFYTMFLREPVGKHVVGVCMTTPCMLCDSQSIYKAISNHLGIGFGETTADEKFTLLELECLGACANAPMMSVGDDYYEDLTPETAVKVIEAFKNGEKPKPGPQNGKRRVAEPSGGKTSLFDDPVPPPLRTDGAL